MLLRKFYVQENEKAPEPKQKKTREDGDSPHGHSRSQVNALSGFADSTSCQTSCVHAIPSLSDCIRQHTIPPIMIFIRLL
jgi:hypothetical protein